MPLRHDHQLPSRNLKVKSQSTDHHTSNSEGLSEDRHGSAGGGSRRGAVRTSRGTGGRGAGGKAGLGGSASSGAGGSSSQGGDAGSCRRVISMILASGDAGRYSSMGSSRGLSRGFSVGLSVGLIVGFSGGSSGNARGGSTGRGSLGRGSLGGSSSGGTRGRRRRNSGRCTSRSSAGALGAPGDVELLGLGEDASVALGGGQEVDLEALSASNALVWYAKEQSLVVSDMCTYPLVTPLRPEAV